MNTNHLGYRRNFLYGKLCGKDVGSLDVSVVNAHINLSNVALGMWGQVGVPKDRNEGDPWDTSVYFIEITRANGTRIIQRWPAGIDGAQNIFRLELDPTNGKWEFYLTMS